MTTIEELRMLRKVVASINSNTKHKLYTAYGQTLTISQWSAYSEVKRATIANRLLKGWDCKRAITESATIGNNQFLRY